MATSSQRVFDVEEVYDRSKLAEVARNLEKKKLALEKMPFILEATKNDGAMMRSCQLPLYNQICPQPKTGTKRQHFNTTKESTQLPDGKRHTGLSPIPLMNDEGEVGV